MAKLQPTDATRPDPPVGPGAADSLPISAPIPDYLDGAVFIPASGSTELPSQKAIHGITEAYNWAEHSRRDSDTW